MSKVIRLSDLDMELIDSYRQFLIRKLVNSSESENNKLYWNFRKMSDSDVLHYILVGVDISCHLGIYPDP